ncbi:hypothetical protein EVAR_4671_1 [Eumeta japonica]|uniref:Uncharacterized protein n=1 Tax=Eumeta variegata TaxID=151549 RepID=A0A4C1YEA9_EUMVA|nr:hypothetical protein EVAR_4671_1 [Eumeta japonica]
MHDAISSSPTPTQTHSTNSRFCKITSAEELPAHPAANHSDPLLQSAVSYEAPLPHHFIQRSLGADISNITTLYGHRCAPRAPDTPLGDSARAESPCDFLCRDVHLVAPIGQSCADGILCRSAAINKIRKPQYVGATDNRQPTCCFGDFLVCQSRTHPRTWVRGSALSFLSTSPRKEKKNGLTNKAARRPRGNLAPLPVSYFSRTIFFPSAAAIVLIKQTLNGDWCSSGRVAREVGVVYWALGGNFVSLLKSYHLLSTGYWGTYA